MNDRFKFRVWDKRKKQYADRYVIGDDGWAYQLHDAGEDSYDLIPDEDVIIEQCAWLKDKNGKLIYEGDLLGESKEDDEFVEICWCDTLASFMCDIYPETYGNLETCDAEYLAKLEIIGNIHEMEVEK